MKCVYNHSFMSVCNNIQIINNRAIFSTDTLPSIYMFSKDRYGKVSNWLNFC